MIVLIIVDNPADDPWLAAVASDYSLSEDSRVFAGTGLVGERIALWVGPEGNAFGCIDAHPLEYVKFSKNPDLCHHEGVDEYEFEAGHFDYNAKRLKLEAKLTFGGM